MAKNKKEVAATKAPSKTKWEDVGDAEVGFNVDELQETTLVSGATFVDFKKTPKFIGKFKRPMLADADDEKMNRKKGDVFAYLFEDANGHEHLVGASFSIEKALTSENVGINSIVSIEFIEQKTAKSGRKFNVYDVKLLTVKK